MRKNKNPGKKYRKKFGGKERRDSRKEGIQGKKGFKERRDSRKEGIQEKTQGKCGKGQKGTFLDIVAQFREKRKNEEIRRARKSRE